MHAGGIEVGRPNLDTEIRADQPTRVGKTIRSNEEIGSAVGDLPRRMANRVAGIGEQANRHILETITQYSNEQGLTPRKLALEEVFAPSTLDL